jgi:hypothetical protein
VCVFCSPKATVLAVVVTQRFQNQSDAAIDSTFLLPLGQYEQLGAVCDWLVERDGEEVLTD